MRHAGADYIEEEVVVDGIRAIRRRKAGSARKAREPYIHLPMSCITVMAAARIPAKAWPLALWVLWHHIVAKRPAAVTAKFALRAAIDNRAARRHAVEALVASGLFNASRLGTEATKVAPTAALRAMVSARSR